MVSPDTRASAALLPTLEGLLRQAGARAGDIRQVALTVGPGGFTGIRLGLALARSLQQVHPQMEVVGLDTLGVLALQHAVVHSTPVPFTVAIDAAGGMAFTQTFTEQAEPLTEVAVEPVAGLVQSAYPLYYQNNLLLPEGAGRQHTASFGPLEVESLMMAAVTDWVQRPAEPVYVKPLGYATVAGRT